MENRETGRESGHPRLTPLCKVKLDFSPLVETTTGRGMKNFNQL